MNNEIDGAYGDRTFANNISDLMHWAVKAVAKGSSEIIDQRFAATILRVFHCIGGSKMCIRDRAWGISDFPWDY